MTMSMEEVHLELYQTLEASVVKRVFYDGFEIIIIITYELCYNMSISSISLTIIHMKTTENVH